MQQKQLIGNNDLKAQIQKLRSLNEFVSRNTVADAIQNKDVVFIYYSGDETINRGYRTIEPFVLGVSTAGNVVLRAWQQNGATDTGNAPKRPNDEIPGWRLFKLDGITSMAKTLRRFEADPAYLATHRPNYNPQDKQMTQIIMAVQPNAAQPPVTGDTSVTKPDTYKGMTNDKNWFQTQFGKFKNTLFGSRNKPAPDTAASKNWFGQQKRDFENNIKRQQNTNQNGI
jgi:hypothetical protein